MKFEHILQIYWSKGILYNGHLQRFNTTFKYLFKESGGFSYAIKSLLIKRFELNPLRKNPALPVNSLEEHFPSSLNIFFSKFSSVNSRWRDLYYRHVIRLYLIKTTRGRSHALGKPCRGQRTWSNAWSAYNNNNTVRSFIGAYQKLTSANKKEEKINYKLIKKKSARAKKKEAVSKARTFINYWF